MLFEVLLNVFLVGEFLLESRSCLFVLASEPATGVWVGRFWCGRGLGLAFRGGFYFWGGFHFLGGCHFLGSFCFRGGSFFGAGSFTLPPTLSFTIVWVDGYFSCVLFGAFALEYFTDLLWGQG